MKCLFADGFSFDDSDVVNVDEIWDRNMKPFLFHNNGSTICVVFGRNLQDAFDEAVDANKFDRWQIKPGEGDWLDYMTADVSEMASGFDATCPEYTSPDGVPYWWKVEPTFMGNASEPFDIETIGVVELKMPPLSFAALYDAMLDGRFAVLKRGACDSIQIAV
jgi:hypothetical protein